MDAIGRFLAVADLWGAWHVLRWHNIRFYLNPVTLKLEPIVFDANTGDGWRREPFAHRQSWLFHFLVTDQAIRRSYTQHVERMLEPEYMSELEEFLVERENVYLSVLHREYPRIPRFDWDTIARKTGTGSEPLSVVNALQLDGRSNATWANPDLPFIAGRLDFMLYSARSLELDQSFVFDSRDLSPRWLRHHGLQQGISSEASDHFPIVADFSW